MRVALHLWVRICHWTPTLPLEISYLYASDMTIALWTILFKGRPGRAYNVGSKNDLSIAELARAICCELGREDLSPKITPPKSPNEMVVRYVPDVSRAERELNIREQVPLGEAIRKTAAFLTFNLLDGKCGQVASSSILGP